MQLTPGKIFLADHRDLLEDEHHRRFSTFNFAGHNQMDDAAFGNLRVFNDETIPAAGMLVQKATVCGFALIVPITGAVICHYNNETFTADAGQILLLPVTAGDELTATNPFAENWINFLYIEIAADQQKPAHVFDFDIAGTINEMVDVIAKQNNLPFSVHIGRFNGREETLKPIKEGQCLFAFVLAGVFELQNRLLHERDGLALWDVEEVDAEALSNDAVLLYIIL